MFVQVIMGRTSDPDALRRHLERWQRDLEPGAVGFEGTLAGVGPDGEVVVMAHFRDAEAAAANSARPEQGEWWAATTSVLDGEPSVRDSTDVAVPLDRGVDGVGFVQVMEGRVADAAAAAAVESPEMLEALEAARPDLLRIERVHFGDGTFVEAACFTSEDAARSGETAPDFTEPRDRFAAAYEISRFIDLRAPLIG